MQYYINIYNEYEPEKFGTRQEAIMSLAKNINSSADVKEDSNYLETISVKNKAAQVIDLYTEAENIALELRKGDCVILYDKEGKPVFDRLRARFIEMAKHPLVG